MPNLLMNWQIKIGIDYKTLLRFLLLAVKIKLPDFGRSENGMECQTALDQVKQLQQEGFTEDMIRHLLPKLEQVSALKEEERQELKHRMEQLLPEVASAKTMPLAEAESNFYRMYSGFGGAIMEVLNQNNQILLEKMDERISSRILKEMNFLFRERENLEEERYRKLDRTIRECQVARQRFSLEEERKKRFRLKG